MIRRFATSAALVGMSIAAVSLTAAAAEAPPTDVPTTTAPTVDPPVHLPAGPPAVASKQEVNSPPTATPQALTTTVSTPVAITLAGTDPDGDDLTFAIQQPPANGELSGDAPDLTYTPEAGFEGVDSFMFTVSDGALQSAPVQVTINVEAENFNDPPIGIGQTVRTTVGEPVTITLDAADPNGDPVVFYISEHPSHGELDESNLPEVVYTPDPGFVGVDEFEFTPNDTEIDGYRAVVRIEVVAGQTPSPDPTEDPTEEPTPTPTPPGDDDVLPDTGQPGVALLFFAGLLVLVGGLATAVRIRRRA